MVYPQALYRKTQHPLRRRLTRPLNGIRHSSSAPSCLSVLSIGISCSRISTGSRSSGTLTSLPLQSSRAPRVAKTTRMCGVPPRCVHSYFLSFRNRRRQRSLTWLAVRDVQIISALHRRLKPAFSPKIVPLLQQGLSPPPRVAPGSAPPVPAEVQERETAARLARQRPLLRVCAELAMVGIIGDGNTARSGGEWIMKSLKDLVSTYFREGESGGLTESLTLGGSFRTTPRCHPYPSSPRSLGRTADRT